MLKKKGFIVVSQIFLRGGGPWLVSSLDFDFTVQFGFYGRAKENPAWAFGENNSIEFIGYLHNWHL